VAGLSRAAPRGIGIALFLLSAALFSPALGCDFLNYDDDLYVTANPELARGLGAAGLRFAFTSFHGANWFPLTWLSWLVDAELFGLDPRAFHATNVLLHAGASALLYASLRRLTGDAWAAAFAAALFALHPTRVEPVAWVAARKDPLSALAFAAALWVYAGSGRRGPGAARLAGVWLCYLLGLLAKPSVVTLPLVLLLLDFWPLRRLAQSGAARIDPAALRRCVIEKLPLFALGAAHSAVVFAAQSSAGVVASLEQLGAGARVANAFAQLAAYLGALLWPTDLAVLYPHPAAALPAAQVAQGALLFAGCSALALSRAASRPQLAVGWLWFLIMLLPMSGLVQVGSQARADRYLYLPAIGLALALAIDAPIGLARAGLSRRGIGALAALALVGLGALSLAQLRHWRSSESLFRHALEVTSDNPIAHAHLGLALETQGRHPEAVAEYRRALALAPDLHRVSNALAWLLATAPEPALRLCGEALALARRAVEESPEREPVVLDTLAAALACESRHAEAERVAAEAAGLARAAGDPELAAAIDARRKRYAQGRSHFRYGRR